MSHSIHSAKPSWINELERIVRCVCVLIQALWINDPTTSEVWRHEPPIVLL